MTDVRASSQSRRWSYLAAASTLLLGAGLLTRLSCTPLNQVPMRGPDPELAEPSTHYEAARTARTVNDRPPARPSDMGPINASSVVLGTAGSTGAHATTEPAALAASEPPATVARNPGIPRVGSRELPLLASIERELQRIPPPEVHALLAEYRRGADRAALIDHVQRSFPGDLSLRVLVLRWIDDVRPEAGRAPVPRAQAPGPGTGPPWVAPIRPRP
jgi:hypothetical protein